MRGALLVVVLVAAGCDTRGGDKTGRTGSGSGGGPGDAPKPGVKAAGQSSRLPKTLAKRFNGRDAGEWGRDLLDLGDAKGRFEASAALRRLGDEGLRFVLAGLTSPDATVRRDAVYAVDFGEAAKYPDVFAPALVPLLADPPPETRVAAARAIAGCRFASAAPDLRAAAAREADEGVRNAMRDALGTLAGK